MQKVLIIQNSIPEYRIPIFNMLAQNVELTVLVSEGRIPEGVMFAVEKVGFIRYHYTIHKKFLYAIARKYDVVICSTDMGNLQYRLLYLLPHKYKLIFWGIGVAASYKCRYDGSEIVAKQIMKLINRADAALFYSDYPVKKYTEMGQDPAKLFVANNTVYVEPIAEKKYNTFVFIGSLYQQKRVDLLINEYVQAWKKNSDIPRLVIIGDGDARNQLETMVKEAGAGEKVCFVGAIFDEKVLAGYFAEAILCFSPDQAGLSVLKSMGYGVPYVTHKNAITGGEIFNVHNGIDGILMEDFGEMSAIFLDAAKNKERYIKMGHNALQHYLDNRQVKQMVDGFLSAINYSIKH